MWAMLQGTSEAAKVVLGHTELPPWLATHGCGTYGWEEDGASARRVVWCKVCLMGSEFWCVSYNAVDLQGDFLMCISSDTSAGGTKICLGVECALALAQLSKGYGSNFFWRRMTYTTQQN